VAWSFAGHDPEELLGVRIEGHIWGVFFAEPVSSHAVDTVLRDLAGDEP
jgi:hypothetical protein